MNDFLIQFAAGALANLIIAVSLYVLIDRRIRRKDRDDQLREAQRVETIRTTENINMQRATLLQQFPPLMQRLVDIQRDAFSTALLSCDSPGATTGLRTVASNLRHFANVHVDTVSTLASLGAEVAEMSEHADLTNDLASISLRLIRSENPDQLADSVASSLERITVTYDSNWRGSSHLDRMNILLAELHTAIDRFSEAEPAQRHILFCTIAEAVGHNTNLLLERVNVAFDHELSLLHRPVPPITLTDIQARQEQG